MSALLDVNVLVALAWPNHIHHGAAHDWFRAESHHGWATSPVTETGFVRVSSNRRAVPTAATVAQAIDALAQIRRLPAHDFWADDISLAAVDEIDVAVISGYRQVTDAHLLALAIRRGGQLVTFDQGIEAIGNGSHVIMLRAS